MRLLPKALIVTSCVGIFLFLAIKLFFPDMFLLFENSVRQFFLGSGKGQFLDERESRSSKRESRPLLTVGFAQDATSLEPTFLDFDVRTRTLQIYEPLVKFDEFLRIIPVLARTWGQISDTEWEFQIRKNVKFHHGRYLNANDIVASFRRATSYEKSELKDFFRGIAMTAPDDFRIRVLLEKPDPFFLQKMPFFLIIPKEFADQVTFSPTGTGPYRFISQKKGEEFSLKRFDEYWNGAPVYERVIYQIIPDRQKRIAAFAGNELDILLSLSPSHAVELQNLNYTVLKRPSLETNFLVFNQNGVLKNLRLRQAVIKSLNRDDFVQFVEGFGNSASQFVSSGVFGFHPDIGIPGVDISGAKDLIKMVSKLELIPLKIVLLKGYENVGDYLKEHLDPVGFSVSLEYTDFNSFESKAKNSDLYFYGWKSDIGTSFDFLKNVVHSGGAFNFSHYSNTQLDALLDEIEGTKNEEQQLELLQKAMKLIVEDDPYGVPLLEPYLLTSIAPDIRFSPRVDGQIFLQNIE